jgi:hypothetical protein
LRQGSRRFASAVFDLLKETRGLLSGFSGKCAKVRTGSHALFSVSSGRINVQVPGGIEKRPLPPDGRWSPPPYSRERVGVRERADPPTPLFESSCPNFRANAPKFMHIRVVIYFGTKYCKNEHLPFPSKYIYK